MTINPEQIKRIIAFRNDRFGEFLLNIPVFRALKETFPNARLIAVVNPSVKELAERVQYIDEIIEWGQGRHSLSERLKLINLLRKKKIDIAVMLNPAKEFNVFTYLAGIPVRAGYDRKWGFLLTHKMKDMKHLGGKHEIEYNLELLSLIGARTENKDLSLSIDDSQCDSLLNGLNIKNSANLLALHPWTSDPVKEWPVLRFRELAARLIGEEGAAIVIIGGKEELARSTEVFGGIEGNLINLTGRTTLTQLAMLLKKCRLIISGDSGPVHLASAVGTPAIAIFRNDIPGKSAKRWGPWGRGHIAVKKANLADITVSEVFDKAREVLSR